MILKICLYILVSLASFSILFYFFSTFCAAYFIYTKTLMRKSKEHWGRNVSEPTELQLKMDDIGMAWQHEHDAYKKDVHIVNNGLNLYGEYYDFGFDKTVFILSGRTESLRYGYFFAKPYSDNKFNVLVIDSRAHGLSDGRFNTVGFEESKDVLAWTKFINQEFNIDTIIFHGICIGAAGGMLAITSPDCPSCVKGIVTEGMFANFGESMKNHLIERNRYWISVMFFINFWMKHYTGHTMKTGPINHIHKLDKPLLMIQSKMDKYSTVENAKKLFELCPSTKKKLVLYEIGDHSMLRITDTPKYDNAISEFLNDNF